MVLLIVACARMFLQALVIDFCLRSCDITWLLQIGLLQKKPEINGRFGEFILKEGSVKNTTSAELKYSALSFLHCSGGFALLFASFCFKNLTKFVAVTLGS